MIRSIAIHARPSASTPWPSHRGTAGAPIASRASASRTIRARARSWSACATLSTPVGIAQTDAKPPLPMQSPTALDQLGTAPRS